MHTSLSAARAATRNVPRLLAGTLFTLGLLMRPAHAQTYTITDLGVLSGQTESQGYALSPAGKVAGESGGYAFYWNGSLHGTGQYGGNGINDAGQLLVSNANVYDISTGMTFIAGDLVASSSLNAQGQVGGEGDSGHGEPVTFSEVFHAFLWTPSTPNGTTGTSLDIDNIDGGYGTDSYVHGINDAGEACGIKGTGGDSNYNISFSPFVWAGVNPGMVLLDNLPGDDLGLALGISSYGHVVGHSDSVMVVDDGGGETHYQITGRHAFLWTPTSAHGTSGSPQGIGTLGGDSIAYAVNATPQVVGNSNGAAFLWDSPHGIRNLNTLIPAPSAWTLTTAQAINDSGQITGSGTISGQTHAYLLTPAVAPPAVAVSRIAVSPGTVYKGAATFGKVTLADNAPTGGETVSLSSSNGAVVSVPASVTVPAGQKSATFAIATGNVTVDTTVSLTATAGGASASAGVRVLTRYTASGTISGTGHSNGVLLTATASGPFLLTATASPNAAIPDNSAYTLSSPLLVSATGTITGVTVGVNITHPHIGDLLVTLIGPDGTSVVLQNQTGGANQNLVTSYPVLFTPSQSLSAFNGKAAGGTWTLKIQDLHAGNAGALNFWNLTFNYNGTLTQTAVAASDGTYTVPSLKAATYTVTPTLSGFAFAPASRSVTVGPDAAGVNFSGGPGIKSLTLSASKKTGGNTVTGTVTLGSAAPSGGQSVSLSSSNTGAATVPGSVTVAQGQTTATFTVTTKPTASPTAVTLTASTGGAPTNATLTVNPGLSSVTVSPGTVKGGSHPTGTVTLSGPAASDLTIALSSSAPSVLSVPASVLVATGATSATFPVTTYKVTASKTVTVTATLGLAKTKTVTVTP